MGLFNDAVPAKAESTSVTSLTDEAIRNLDQGLIAKCSAVSDTVLAESTRDGGGEFGKQLAQLAGAAKGFDPKQLMRGKGLLAGLFRSEWSSVRGRFVSSFHSFQQQVDNLVGDLKKHADLHKGREDTLKSLFVENAKLYNGLQDIVVKGRDRVAEEKTALQALPAPADGMEAQILAERRTTLTRYEKRLHDLDICMTLALQAGAQIQLMRDNGRALVEKFDTLVEITVPAWKRQFALYILQMEQKQSVEVASQIDDATNAAIRKNAELLGQNTVQIAEAAQRNVVDLETVQEAHHQFIQAMEDSNRVYAEAEQRRETEAKALASMRQDFIQKVAQPGGLALKR